MRVAVADSPAALDGLGRALWWLREERDAVVYRERAYAGFRRDGELARAARIALWLSREYALAFGNDAAAGGWLARAERLLRDVAPGAEQGWLDLARSERTRDREESSRLASAALEVALTAADTDLELRALAQLGFAEVAVGKIDEGLAHLDEAMAAATSGEPASLDTFADVCCTLMLACERAGDAERPQQWSRVLEEFVRRYDHVTLLAFCRTCCADVFAANGRVDAAEEELVAAIRELTEAGQRSRCVQPATRLAGIRVLQGRFDEAEQLLVGSRGRPRRDPRDRRDARGPRRGTNGGGPPGAASRRDRLDEPARSSAPRAARPGAACGRPRAGSTRRRRDCWPRSPARPVASGSKPRRLLPEAALPRQPGMQTPSTSCSRRSTDSLGSGSGSRPRKLGSSSPALWQASLRPRRSRRARHARNELEALGASREADAAAALMRSLGARGRAGPRSLGSLSRRETEVLRLLGEGLSNRDIAGRLFISPKTAEHHVGRIYGKLGLKSRGEAAAYAVRSLGAE